VIEELEKPLQASERISLDFFRHDDRANELTSESSRIFDFMRKIPLLRILRAFKESSQLFF
jgi:hypothetical protein